MIEIEEIIEKFLGLSTKEILIVRRFAEYVGDNPGQVARTNTDSHSC